MVVNDYLIGKSVMLIRGDTIVPKQNNPQKTIRGRFFIYHTSFLINLSYHELPSFTKSSILFSSLIK